MQGLPLVYLFLYFIKKIGWGAICEADVWVQHGSVRRVMWSETLNTSARLTLLTVPGSVGQCARLANDYQAQLSPAGTKSWSDHCTGPSEAPKVGESRLDQRASLGHAWNNGFSSWRLSRFKWTEQYVCGAPKTSTVPVSSIFG